VLRSGLPWYDEQQEDTVATTDDTINFDLDAEISKYLDENIIPQLFEGDDRFLASGKVVGQKYCHRGYAEYS
ncbi:dTMP kinase, partial [Pseudomonas aeruginosa]